ncbi:hypothetical protein [Geodermatophilus amargosae]|uniref:hypothetical protein n=1 Tax=Geodermatophilus amargosae TaxID=1296565 RepID=UPI0034DF3706
MFLVLVLLFPVAVLAALLAVEAHLHRGRGLAGDAWTSATLDRPELYGRGRTRVH